MQLVRDGDTLQVRHVRDGADGEAPVHEPVVDEHVAHAEQRDAKARPEAQPCARGVTTILLVGPVTVSDAVVRCYGGR